MTNEELKQNISDISPNAAFDETGEFLVVNIPSENLFPLIQQLRSQGTLCFDYLFCLTCIDWKDHFMMVYHLNSKVHNHTLVVKAKIVDIINPTIETVCGIWKTAEFHEREVFDLFGIKFNNHPDLRRLFLEDEWVGFPLRKNYEDEHMIEL